MVQCNHIQRILGVKIIISDSGAIIFTFSRSFWMCKHVLYCMMICPTRHTKLWCNTMFYIRNDDFQLIQCLLFIRYSMDTLLLLYFMGSVIRLSLPLYHLSHSSQ